GSAHRGVAAAERHRSVGRAYAACVDDIAARPARQMQALFRIEWIIARRARGGGEAALRVHPAAAGDDHPLRIDEINRARALKMAGDTGGIGARHEIERGATAVVEADAVGLADRKAFPVDDAGLGGLVDDKRPPAVMADGAPPVGEMPVAGQAARPCRATQRNGQYKAARAVLQQRKTDRSVHDDELPVNAPGADAAPVPVPRGGVRLNWPALQIRPNSEFDELPLGPERQTGPKTTWPRKNFPRPVNSKPAPRRISAAPVRGTGSDCPDALA